jgi:hypothetical protein
MAEEEGFEPPIPFQVRQFSRLEPSTTRPLFRALLQLFQMVSRKDGLAPSLTKKRTVSALPLFYAVSGAVSTYFWTPSFCWGFWRSACCSEGRCPFCNWTPGALSVWPATVSRRHNRDGHFLKLGFWRCATMLPGHALVPRPVFPSEGAVLPRSPRVWPSRWSSAPPPAYRLCSGFCSSPGRERWRSCSHLLLIEFGLGVTRISCLAWYLP